MQLYVQYKGSEVTYPLGLVTRVQFNKRMARLCRWCRLRRLAARFMTALAEIEDGY